MESPLLDSTNEGGRRSQGIEGSEDSQSVGESRAPRHSILSEQGFVEQMQSMRNLGLLDSKRTTTDSASRLISKDGGLQVSNKLNRRSMFRSHIAQDIFTTFCDAPWIYVLGGGAILYVSMWMTFGILYYIFNNGNLPGCKPSQVLSFLDAFLLSIDTQTTIGFGNYAVDSSCVHAVVVLTLQCLCSTFVDAAFMGALFAKLSRPSARAKSLIFSRFACISEEDGVRYLTFRVADQRKHQLVEAHARLLLYHFPALKTEIKASEMFHEVSVESLKLETSEIFLLLPFLIRHRIDESSPLWAVSLNALTQQRAEFVLLLEGSTAATSQTTQARRSYLPSEILLGHEFEPCCQFAQDGGYMIDLDRIHSTRPSILSS